jgi:hypothetical protein
MKSQSMQNVSVWFGVLMVVVVTGLATAVLFTDFMSDRLFGNKRIFFIVLLYAYAVYRGYRVYAYFRRPDNDPQL